MKFLIIIPAKDEEEFVEKTLVSLMEQSIKPARVILVDDGSKDN
ncbi:MAG: glycosyltransferase family 2 protein, partial [Saprospiraceae bacterium]|nr:glycosyltransferase family 2 protein [Saprospiraceae bacterium]